MKAHACYVIEALKRSGMKLLRFSNRTSGLAMRRIAFQKGSLSKSVMRYLDRSVLSNAILDKQGLVVDSRHVVQRWPLLQALKTTSCVILP